MRPFTRGLAGEARKLMALAVPIIAGQVGQMVLGLVDTIMIGRVGVVPLAAAAFAGTVISVFLIFGFGLLASVTILVARSYGSDRTEACGEYLRHGLAMACVLSVISAVGLHLGVGMLGWFGQPPEVVAEGRSYFIIISWSLVAAYFFQVFRQFSESLSSAWTPMVIMTGGILLNIFLNWVLIYGNLGAPALGLEGAGWATLMARVATAATLVVVVVKTPRLAAMLPGSWWARLELDRFRELLKIGFPISLQHLSEMGAFAMAAFMMGWIGTEALAAHQIAISCAAFTFMFPLGLSFAAGIRTGQASGAGDYHGVRQICFSALFLGFLVMALAATVFLIWGRELARQFVDDPVVTDLAGRLLVIAAIFQVFDGVQVVGAGLLRGLTDVKIPTVIVVIAYWGIALPAAWLTGIRMGWGAEGIWGGMAVGLAIAAVALASRVIRLTGHSRPGREPTSV